MKLSLPDDQLDFDKVVVDSLSPFNIDKRSSSVKHSIQKSSKDFDDEKFETSNSSSYQSRRENLPLTKSQSLRKDQMKQNSNQQLGGFSLDPRQIQKT